MTRSFVRLRTPIPGAPFDAATAFREALTADGAAELWDTTHTAEPRLAFTLRGAGIAVLVVSISGEVLGVFADPARAVAHGFDLLDRTAKHQRAARPRPTRARRRTTEKAQAR